MKFESDTNTGISGSVIGENDGTDVKKASEFSLVQIKDKVISYFRGIGKEYRIVTYSIIGGAAAVFADALADHIFFLDTPFIDSLLFNIPTHEIFNRALLFLTFIGIGLITAAVSSHFSSKERELQDTRDELEYRVRQRTENLLKSNNRLQLETVERTKAENLLKKQLEFTRIINRISAGFIKPDPKGIKSKIENSLDKVATFLGYDTGFLFTAEPDEKNSESNPNTFSAGKNLTCLDGATTDMIFKKAGKGPIFQLADISAGGIADKEIAKIFTVNQILAIIIIPLEHEGKNYGYLAYTKSDEPAKPNNDYFELMEVMREVFINGLEFLRSDKALRKSEAKYHSLFDNVPVGLYRTSKEGDILDANEALVNILGYASKEDLLNANVKAFYSDPAERERFCSKLDEADIVNDFNLTLKRKDGTAVKVLDSSHAVKENGKLVYYEGNIRAAG